MQKETNYNEDTNNFPTARDDLEKSLSEWNSYKKFDFGQLDIFEGNAGDARAVAKWFDKNFPEMIELVGGDLYETVGFISRDVLEPLTQTFLSRHPDSDRFNLDVLYHLLPYEFATEDQTGDKINPKNHTAESYNVVEMCGHIVANYTQHTSSKGFGSAYGTGYEYKTSPSFIGIETIFSRIPLAVELTDKISQLYPDQPGIWSHITHDFVDAIKNMKPGSQRPGLDQINKWASGPQPHKGSRAGENYMKKLEEAQDRKRKQEEEQRSGYEKMMHDTFLKDKSPERNVQDSCAINKQLTLYDGDNIIILAKEANTPAGVMDAFKRIERISTAGHSLEKQRPRDEALLILATKGAENEVLSLFSTSAELALRTNTYVEKVLGSIADLAIAHPPIKPRAMGVLIELEQTPYPGKTSNLHKNTFKRVLRLLEVSP